MTQGHQRWVRIPPARLDCESVCLYRDELPEGVDPGHGFQYLDKFDLVVYRLGAHKFSAIQMDRGADYERCEQALPTMRVVPLDPSVLWLRRNDTTAELLRLWREGSDDWTLALLRAVYLARPLLYILMAQCFEEEREDYGGLTVVATRDRDDWTLGIFDGEAMAWRGRDNGHTTAAAAIAAGKAWIDSTREE